MKLCSINGCVRRHKAHGWCGTHYRRWCRHGDPTSTQVVDGDTLRADWLREKVTALKAEPTDECVLWPYSTSGGYGCVSWEGEVRRVHHVVLLLDGREIPKPGEHTRHSCNRPSCFNPRHLLVGTPKQNRQDFFDAGGVSLGRGSPLTEDDVRTIRAEYIGRTSRYDQGGNADELAARYGITVGALKKVVYGRTWKHVGGARRAA